MVVDEGESPNNDHGASLARLRLFLAPHTPANEDHDSSTTTESHDQDQDKWQHESFPSSIGDPEGGMPELVDEEEEAQSKQVTIPVAGAVASVSPLSQATKEFARVKYLLQCCLPGYKVHDDIMMWDMTNPSLVAQYEQHSHGLLELDSWVAVNDLGAAMGDVHSYGFTSLDANQTGMKFTTGNLQLGPPVKKGTRQLVLCKIAVGRSLAIRSEEDAKKRLPAGYNSFYLRHGAQEDDADRGYYHEYILDNTFQILPQHLVRFRFSTVDSKTAGPCALCEKHSAAVVCRACEAEICSTCDQEVHSANKLVSRHKRVPLRQKAKTNRGAGAPASRGRRRSSTPSLSALSPPSDAAPLSPLSSPRSASSNELQDADVDAIVAKQLEDGLADVQMVCRFHEGKHVEFYCSVCELPVCVHCKMVGDHSVGEKGSHRLLTIADAYELSLRESLKTDPLIESRKSVIEHKLQSLAKSKEDVLHNKEQVEAAIRLQWQQALDRLEEEVHAKMSVLDGEALEYQRQLQQIEWAEDTLDDLRSCVPAVEFLGTWNQHKMVRSEQRDFPAFAHGSSADQVKGDLELVGRLQVVSGEQMNVVVNGEGSDNNSRLSSARSIRLNHDSIGASSGSQRHPSDADIRKKILSMKATLPSDFMAPSLHTSSGAESPGRNTFISPKGMQMMEEIRSELLEKSTLATSSRTATFADRVAIAQGSPISARHLPPTTPTRATMKMDTSSALRGFSIQPTWKRASLQQQQQSPMGRRSRLVTDAWSTLLRQEMALATPTKDQQQH